MKTAVTNLYNAGTSVGFVNGNAVIISYNWSGWTNGTAGTKVTKTINLSSYYTDYQNLTEDNIRVMMTTVGGTGGNNLHFYVDSYTPSTGKLQIATTVNFSNPKLAIIILPTELNAGNELNTGNQEIIKTIKVAGRACCDGGTTRCYLFTDDVYTGVYKGVSCRNVGNDTGYTFSDASDWSKKFGARAIAYIIIRGDGTYEISSTNPNA